MKPSVARVCAMRNAIFESQLGWEVLAEATTGREAVDVVNILYA
jgi:hypothetical protein